MSPREVVTRAIEFQKPERLPISGYGELSDTFWLASAEAKPPQAAAIKNADQWLCVWDRTDIPNMGQVVGHPLTDLTRRKDFPWPDGNDPRRYEKVPAQLNAALADPKTKDKYFLTGVFMLLWERMHSLHGFENCMVSLMDDDPAIHEVADRIVDFDVAIMRNMHRLCGRKMQGFSFTEDWGTQLDTHVSPDLFRQFFMPRYQRIFDAVHECGWHVWMHSCGKINKFLPLLIEVGVDVINMQQPRTNGIIEVGQEFAGKICFETLCDIQTTLPLGNKQEIETEAALLMNRWGTSEGGFILGDYGDAAAIGAQADVKQFMLEAFRRQDPWKKGGK